ncbi:phosphomannomutase/phosphoglucomutase [Ferrovibrio sp. MS7]|uniref:phosphoglucomutase/phosphomannomutase PgmG n=1 Tax=Ferrovibrio plantarum TaxID=3119164 RepID=UPI003136291F
MTHVFHKSILREYDIRGIVGETLWEADADAIGRAFGTRVRRAGGGVVCVGWDGRLSSPAMAAALVRGLTSTGCTAVQIGCGPTPMLYYAAKARHADGGIMVTGSHNPANHNGFKMVFGNKPFFGADILDIGRLAAAGDCEQGDGLATEASVFEEYVQRLLQDFTPGRPLRVVWDCGNGAAGAVATALAQRLPGQNTVLYGEIDGSFPNHHPDPTEPHNLIDLIAAVRAQGADLGIAFDGDGDRIGVVDGEGEILWGDKLLIAFAEQILADRPGAPIIADVKASKVFFDQVDKLGGKAVMGRTGHSLIKTMMADIGSPLAGEMSGHIFFADRYYGFDDALYAAIRLLGIVAGWPDQGLADWRKRLPKLYNTPEIRIDCADSRKFDVIAEVRERLHAAGTAFNAVDGIRTDTEHGWWLLRASNTQAVLVARCEATAPEGLPILLASLWQHLDACGIARPAGY